MAIFDIVYAGYYCRLYTYIGKIHARKNEFI
ncbi:hypothetical protein F-VV10_0141 [Faustovirus]|nr:hypothetical protein F-VV10_0141 [Faustovirus]